MGMTTKISRRALLGSMVASCIAPPWSGAASTHGTPAPDFETLKGAAESKGRMVGVFSGRHDLMAGGVDEKIIASEFDLLSVGNDLKMDRVHPTPDTYDFNSSDYDINWSKQHGMKFRGHTLVWHNALPSWFRSYVNKGNAEQVLTSHIHTVVSRYAGSIYSWDVVNEVIRNVDGRPDGLRAWPWLQPIGPQYIDIAFRAASEADPKAKLFLNENNFEHDLPWHAQRRDTLLQLATNLKKAGTPITGIGIQGHLKADVPLANVAFVDLLKALRDLGLELMVTELDVDDTQIPNATRDEVVAQRYAEYLDLVGPFVRVISFQNILDPEKNQGQEFDYPKRQDGLTHRPDLFDTKGTRKPAYFAVRKKLAALPSI